MTFTAKLDERFGEATAPAEWQPTADALAKAGSYWITTVRADGRPHVTPLVGVWVDGTFVFCTGPTEQKARNLQHNPYVVVTTGTNTWNSGVDIVVEGRVERITGRERLTALADAYRRKYGNDWDFTCDDEVFGPDGMAAHVFAVTPAKVIVFTKAPHGQTTFRP